MYGMLLATLLSADNAMLGADIQEEIQELKKSVQEIKRDETQARIDDLQRTIDRLRERLVEGKLDELRRDIQELRYEQIGYGVVPLLPRPLPPSQRATISLSVPAGAAFTVNGQEIPLPSENPLFVSPPLEPGRDYFYDFNITVMKDGKPLVRVKRVSVRSGAIVRLNYEDMEPR
jgi:uncharacterized protein (TIGR03000 family)